MARLVQYGRLMRGIAFMVGAFQEATGDRAIARLATPTPLGVYDQNASPFLITDARPRSIGLQMVHNPANGTLAIILH